MACQTGIRADEHLLKFFNQCKLGKVRLAKVVVKNEQLRVNFDDRGSSDWRADWRKNLPECVDSFEPCFILFRLDSPSGWLLISFADDRAPVREKMLVAATRATFKAEFGQSHIKYEYHVTNKNDISLEAFERWLHSKEEPAPLSEVEKEIESAHRDQKISLPSAIAAQTLKGVMFPIDQDAEAELRKLAAHQIDFVQLSVDTLNEAIKLEAKTEQLHPDQLTATVLQNCNLQPDKKMEIDSKEVLSYDVLLDYVHPPSLIRDKGFAKPPGPPQRGTRRVTKAVV